MGNSESVLGWDVGSHKTKLPWPFVGILLPEDKGTFWDPENFHCSCPLPDDLSTEARANQSSPSLQQRSSLTRVLPAILSERNLISAKDVGRGDWHLLFLSNFELKFQARYN